MYATQALPASSSTGGVFNDTERRIEYTALPYGVYKGSDNIVNRPRIKRKGSHTLSERVQQEGDMGLGTRLNPPRTVQAPVTGGRRGKDINIPFEVSCSGRGPA